MLFSQVTLWVIKMFAPVDEDPCLQMNSLYDRLADVKVVNSDGEGMINDGRVEG